MKPLSAAKAGIILFSVLYCCLASYAQSYTFPDVTVTKGPDTLFNAMDGGMNSPQFSQFDIDGDGLKEIIIFDKLGDKFLVYGYNTSKKRYEYIADPPVQFPTVDDLALIRDYDGDGIMDLFAIPVDDIVGFAVWKGIKAGEKTVLQRVDLKKWFFNVLSYPGTNGLINVYATISDIPDILDIDNDGDLDIFSFNEQGSHMVFYKNNSVELGYGRDSLIFTLQDRCYGKFLESGIDNTITLSNNPDQCATSLTDETPLEVRHAGSTILIKDIDKDGKKDILLGDIAFNNVVYLRNTGSDFKAYATAEVNHFPNPGNFTDLGPFPSTFSIDYGTESEDCIVATSNVGTLADERQLNWLYTYDPSEENNYRLLEKDFLIRNTLDLGIECSPVVFDVNADGRPDIIAGNKFIKGDNNAQFGKLVYLKNTGVGGQLSFEVADDDFAGLKSFGITQHGYKPLFVDIDNNNHMDMLVGTERGNLLHFESTTPIGQEASFELKSEAYQDIKVPSRAAPAAYDFDNDGDMDLIIGDKNGNFCLFVNTGSPTAPAFTGNFQEAPNVYRFGNVTVKEVGDTEGDATPSILRFQGKDLLISGSYNGRLYAFSGLNGTSSVQLEPFDLNTGSLYSGRQNKPVFADLNGDGLLELIQGNIRGGINILSTNINQDGSLSSGYQKENVRLLLYPNPAPAGNTVNFNTDQNICGVDVFDMTGRQLVSLKNTAGINSLELPADLPQGIYLVRVTDVRQNIVFAKLVVLN